MSWRQKVGNAISSKPQNNFSQEAMKKVGIQTISTERIERRQEELKDFNKNLTMVLPKSKTAPDEIFEWYVDQWYNIWNMYKENQIQWLRAGSNPIFSLMVTAIEEMKEEIDVAIEANRTMLENYSAIIAEAKLRQDKTTEKKLTNKKLQLVTDFHVAYLVKLGLKFVGMQGNLCWLTEDVTIPESFPIMTNQPIQQQYPNTSLDEARQMEVPQQGKQQNWGPTPNAKKENQQ